MKGNKTMTEFKFKVTYLDTEDNTEEREFFTIDNLNYPELKTMNAIWEKAFRKANNMKEEWEMLLSIEMI